MNRLSLSVPKHSLPWKLRGRGLRRYRSLWRPQSQCGVPRGSRGFTPFASPMRAWSMFDQFNRKTVGVDVGSSGEISVDIWYEEDLFAEPLAPLIIYLPPSGVHLQEEHPEKLPSYIMDLPFPKVVARINYRWGIPTSPESKTSQSSQEVFGWPSFKEKSSTGEEYESHGFPVPLHDTLAGYDYLTASYLARAKKAQDLAEAQFNTSTNTFKPPPLMSQPRPVFLTGDFLGGTLATSLALTSTLAPSTSSRNAVFRIAGLLTRNAVLDWTAIATSKPDLPSSEHLTPKETGEWEAQTLHYLKQHLFTNPGGAFDPFASPTLFFRTPGLGVPKEWPGSPASPTEEEAGRYSTSIDPSILSSHDEVLSEYAGVIDDNGVMTPPPSPKPDTTTTIPTSPKSKNQDLPPETTRMSHLKFPPTVSSSSSLDSSGTTQTQLQIPRSLFLYSSSSTGSSPAPKTKKSSSFHNTVEQTTPQSQAQTLAHLMRRSILLHELKDRTMWDEGFDAKEVAEERVRCLDLDSDLVLEMGGKREEMKKEEEMKKKEEVKKKKQEEKVKDQGDEGEVYDVISRLISEEIARREREEGVRDKEVDLKGEGVKEVVEEWIEEGMGR